MGEHAMVGQFTAVYMRKGSWYVGYVEEIPGVNTQGRTLSETRSNLKEALEMVLEANRQMAHRSHTKDAIEEPISIAVG
jgi:predicted RNase H-like HicB family nuclease